MKNKKDKTNWLVVVLIIIMTALAILCLLYKCQCEGPSSRKKDNTSVKHRQKEDKEKRPIRREREQEPEEKAEEKDYKVVVLNYCHDQDYVISIAISMLTQHDFTVTAYYPLLGMNVDTLRAKLDDDFCQLWIISDSECRMNEELYNLAYDHFYKGRGLFIWSDNAAYFADANVMLDSLFHAKMSGFYSGNRIVFRQNGDEPLGIVCHPITQDLDSIYEGFTISHIEMSNALKPLIYSSDSNVVTAYHDGKCRALVDGGSTRLSAQFWHPSTEPFIVNCACWLAKRPFPRDERR